MHVSKIYYKLDKIMRKREVLIHQNSTVKQVKKKMEYLGVISYCVNSLEDEYKELFTKTYLADCYKFWWLDYYCKSSYYRKRIIAVTLFVQLFETIYENITDFTPYCRYAYN